MTTEAADVLKDIELLKEINESARHWEKLVFDNVKMFFKVVSLALGAAGAVIGWSTVTRPTQKVVIVMFLVTAIVVSSYALKAIRSTEAYLRGFYLRRDGIASQNPALKLRDKTNESGSTLDAIGACFWLAILLSTLLVIVTVTALEPSRSLLDGSRLSGADLSAVHGLTQKDLEGACGDASTKLPAGLKLKQCSDSSVQKPAAESDTQGNVEPSSKK
jgi:hypothetical protein